MPRVEVTGHRGLSPHTQALIAAALRTELEPYAGTETELVGVSCLAGGPDQLFARIVLDLGGILEVVVPDQHYRDGLDPAEQRGYDELLATAKHTERLPFIESTEQGPPGGSSARTTLACVHALRRTTIQTPHIRLARHREAIE